MLQSEFEKLIGKRIGVELYQNVVEPVYTFHPSINDKDGKTQIKLLWDIGGEVLLKDMLATAEKAKACETNIHDYENAIKNIEAAMEADLDAYKKRKSEHLDKIHVCKLCIERLRNDLKDMGKCPINLPGRDAK